MNRFFILLIGLVSWTVSLAAPQKVTAVYEATRDGKPFATVTENFQQIDGHYRIESITKGSGVYALFGERRLSSEGETSSTGLKPIHFEQQQGEKKAVTADFDWVAGKLTLTSKKQSSVVDLPSGTQDVASISYQFRLFPLDNDLLSVPVTTGKKLRQYQFRVANRNEALDIMGGLKTIHLVNASPDNADEKEFWLATEKQYLPAKIIFRDENGARIEQVLIHLRIE